ncbi:MAG TPA: 1,4-dihydroxy-2-naphthoate polyprenyltransferase [Kiritimatiellia bacterium]|jgi:1,4-dihydroxy-2-naphthoate octaprenyltransferase
MPVVSPFVWIQAARPKTLWAGVAPALIGTAMAAADGFFHLSSALFALLGAVLIQVGTNYCNDYCDFRKGADTSARVGPVRATQAGLVAPGAMLAATVIVFLLAALTAVPLFLRAGWPVAAISAAGILSGVLYTAGPKPLAYVGLGDIFVLLFFGPVAVAGTYFVQALRVESYVIFAGLAPGLLSVAVLTVNNLRDIETDRFAGKRTLAVRLGRGFARVEYAACILGATLVPLVIYAAKGWTAGLPGVLVAVPGALAIRAVWRTDGPALNPLLGRTALLLLLYSVLFSLGWWLA